MFSRSVALFIALSPALAFAGDPVPSTCEVTQNLTLSAKPLGEGGKVVFKKGSKAQAKVSPTKDIVLTLGSQRGYAAKTNLMHACKGWSGEPEPKSKKAPAKSAKANAKKATKATAKAQPPAKASPVAKAAPTPVEAAAATPIAGAPEASELARVNADLKQTSPINSDAWPPANTNTTRDTTAAAAAPQAATAETGTPPPSPWSPPSAAPPPAAESGSVLRPAGYVVLALGIATLAAGGIMEGVSQSQASSLTRDINNYNAQLLRTQAQGESLTSRRSTIGTLDGAAVAAGVVGLCAIGGSIAMIIAGGDAHEYKTKTTVGGVGLFFTPGGVAGEF